MPNGTAFVDDVTFFEATQLPGYKELKALPVSPLKNTSLDIGDGRTPLPAAGTVRITRWVSGQRG